MGPDGYMQVLTYNITTKQTHPTNMYGTVAARLAAMWGAQVPLPMPRGM
jgi:hypothetical protein